MISDKDAPHVPKDSYIVGKNGLARQSACFNVPMEEYRSRVIETAQSTSKSSNTAPSVRCKDSDVQVKKTTN